MPISDFPIIPPLCDIANLFECMAMFYFVKRLSALRIAAKPFVDRFPLSDSFAIFLHHALDVGGFGRGKERLCRSVPKRITASTACLNTSLAL